MDQGYLVHSHSKAKLYLVGKILLTYVALIVLWLWLVHMYAAFGQGWIKFAVGIMWIAGAVAVWGVPEDREQTIKETKWAVAGYLLFLLIYRVVIVKFSQFSPDEVGVALGVNVPVSSATSALGFIQNMLMIISILTPVGFCIWVAQKFKVHQGGKKKDEAFVKYKNLR
ncbi:hypothetical protein ACFYKX_10100 [Cytobacillus sp. FJAT-54145]|uniref:Uncharacterized protein n=1 Tax=Cytobacillus spartinae TaxID=3299023 RepID=A0ABW6KDJ0_9BACI